MHLVFVGRLLAPAGIAQHRARFVEATRAWFAEGRPLGTWTIPACSVTRPITCSNTPGRGKTEIWRSMPQRG